MKTIDNYIISIISGHITIDTSETFINDINRYELKNRIIQAFNGDLIFGMTHLLSAIEHTLRAKEQGRLITHSLSMELLLYASGERQLKHAIPKIGIQPGKNRIVLIIIKKKSDTSQTEQEIKDLLISKYHFNEDSQVLEPNPEALQQFGISPEELDTIPHNHYHHLVLEKVAMVDIIK
jgi:KEOPS complex subunit Cgi121